MTTTAERNETTGPEGAYFLNEERTGAVPVSPAHAKALRERDDAASTAGNMQALADHYAELAQRWHGIAVELETRADEVAMRTGSATLGRGAVAFAASPTVE